MKTFNRIASTDLVSLQNRCMSSEKIIYGRKTEKELVKIYILKKIWEYLKRISKKKIDMFTLNQATNMPLIICQKLVGVLSENSKHFLNKDKFIDGFFSLYYGSEKQKIIIISKMCDFKGRYIIQKNDVLLLLYHFHYRYMNALKEKLLEKIVNKFFENEDNIYLETFMKKSYNENNDIIAIFKMFFEKCFFIKEEHIKLYELLKDNPNYIIVDSTSILQVETIIESKGTVSEHDLEFNKYSTIKQIDETEYLNISNVDKNLGYTNSILTYSKTKNNINNINNINNNNKSGEDCDKDSNILRVSPTYKRNTYAKKKKLYSFDLNQNNSHSKISKYAKEYIECIKKAKTTTYVFDDDDEMRFSINSFENDYKELKSSILYQNNILKAETIKITSDFSNEVLNEYDNIDQYKYFATKKSCKVLRNTKIGNMLTMFGSNINNNNQTKVIHSHLHKNMGNKEFKVQSFICFKLNRKYNKIKKVKFIYIDKLMFYFNWIDDTKKYFLKKIILISQMYVKVYLKDDFIKNIDNNNSKDITNQLLSNFTYYLEMTTAIRGTIKTKRYFIKNFTSLNKFTTHINKIENIKDIDQIYEGEKIIGEGGFGQILKGYHRVSKEPIAIKQIYKNLKENQEVSFQCALWEKDAFIFLNHLKPNYILRCYDFFETEDKIYYVQEYLSDGDLKAFLNSNNNYINTSLVNNLNTLDSITLQVLKGINIFHKYGILHRDIKHSNILLRNNGVFGISAKIIDFGLSKTLGKYEYAIENYGSLMFKSPEFYNSEKYNFSIDLWALGITVFYLYSKGNYPCNYLNNKDAIINRIKNADFNLDHFINVYNFSNLAIDIIKNTLVLNPKKRFDAEYFINKYDNHISIDDDFSSFIKDF